MDLASIFIVIIFSTVLVTLQGNRGITPSGLTYIQIIGVSIIISVFNIPGFHPNGFYVCFKQNCSSIVTFVIGCPMPHSRISGRTLEGIRLDIVSILLILNCDILYTCCVSLHSSCVFHNLFSQRIIFLNYFQSKFSGEYALSGIQYLILVKQQSVDERCHIKRSHLTH